MAKIKKEAEIVEEAQGEIEEMVTDTIIKVEEIAQNIEDAVLTIAEDVIVEAKVITEKVSGLAVNTLVEISEFYVRALNGLRGTVIGLDENGHTLIELESGAKASFKEENLLEVK